MSAPRLQTDTVVLAAEIPAGGWPWFTALDQTAQGAFGVDPLCGPIDYAVFYNNQGQKEPNDLASLVDNSSKIVLHPTNAHPIQTYSMLLCGKLRLYNSVENCIGFSAVVTACQATIVAPAQGSIPDVTGYLWYDNKVELNINAALAGFR